MVITNAITLLAAMSMSVERIVEILKGMLQPAWPFIPKQQDDVKEGRRRMAIHLLSAAIGTFLAYIFWGQIQLMLPGILTKSNPWPGCAVLGLLSSGGSAFWNQSLGIVEEFKKFRKQLNNQQVNKP